MLSKRLPIFFFCMLLFPHVSPAANHCVVMIHGLTRTHFSMMRLAKYLQAHHYYVVNKGYPSATKTVKEIAEQDIPPMIDACLAYHPDSIYFVTHSIGGVILRQYLQSHPMSNKTRIVMLAPPNHGSPLADIFKHETLFKMITGPAGQELTTEKTSPSNHLKQDLPYQVGIIAGNFNFLPFMKLFFHEDNDGKVAVSSTRLTNMTDFVVLPVSHTFIMNNPRVAAQTLHFFEDATFIH